jgi:hypothetical protein
MSNDLIARLHARRAHGIVGGTQLVISTNPDALCTEAADALTAQAATIAGQAVQIEALRAFAQGLVDDYQSDDGMAGAKYIVRDAVAALASGKAVTP